MKGGSRLAPGVQFPACGGLGRAQRITKETPMKKVSNKEALRGPCVLAAGALDAVDGGASRGGSSSGRNESNNNNTRNDSTNNRNDSNVSPTQTMTGGGPKQSKKDLLVAGGILGGMFWATGEAGNTMVNGSDNTSGPGLSASGSDRFSTW
jgi:hypothetical protein